MPRRIPAAETLTPREISIKPQPIEARVVPKIGGPSPEQRQAAEAREVQAALESVLQNLDATHTKLEHARRAKASSEAVREFAVTVDSWANRARKLAEKLPPEAQEAYVGRIPGFEPAHLRAARKAGAAELGAMHEGILQAHEHEEARQRVEEQTKRAKERTRTRLHKAHERMMRSFPDAQYMESSDKEATAQATQIEERAAVERETEKELRESPWFETPVRVRERRRRIRALPEQETLGEVVREVGSDLRERERRQTAQRKKELDLRAAFEARVSSAHRAHPDLVPFTMRNFQDATERLRRLEKQTKEAKKKMGFFGRLGRGFSRAFGAPPDETEVEIRALKRQVEYWDLLRDALSESYDTSLSKEDLKKLRRLRAEFAEE